jgi:hypothetical protein
MASVETLRIKVKVDVSAALRSLLAIDSALRGLAAINRVRAEILTTFAMLGGWALVTLGVALLTTWKVWPISGGLLLLSCGGWRLLWAIASDGLYTLTRTRRG